MLVKGGQRRCREVAGEKRVLIHLEDGVDGTVGDGAHDVDFVAIAHDIAEAPCTLVELCRQAKVAVIGDARADELVVLVGLDKISDACCGRRVVGVLAKEDPDAQRRMAHALGILKGVPASQLLEAAHIVQQSAKPGQVNILCRPALLTRHGITCLGNVVRMLDFECDARIGGIVSIGIAFEGRGRPAPIDSCHNDFLKSCVFRSGGNCR